MLCPYSALNEICRQKKIIISKKNVMSLIRKSQSFHKINEKINESNVENNLKVSDREDIASTNEKTDSDTTSKEILKNVRRKLDFEINCEVESEISQYLMIKQANETLESDCKVTSNLIGP
jgi:hypothetical protein